MGVIIGFPIGRTSSQEEQAAMKISRSPGVASVGEVGAAGAGHDPDSRAAPDPRRFARAVVANAMARGGGRDAIPGFLRGFLEGVWRVCLGRIGQQEGLGGEHWREAVATMDDLLWCFQPMQGWERQRRLAMIPELYQRLRVELERQGVPEAQSLTFFSRFARHAARFAYPHPHGEYEAAADVDTVEVPVVPFPSQLARDGRGPDRGDAGHGSSDEAFAEGDEILDGADTDEDVAGLRVGQWVEFVSERGTRRTLRLKWISGLHSVLMFEDLRGGHAISFCAKSFRTRLEAGVARIVEPGVHPVN
jgi:hypothetical protein